MQTDERRRHARLSIDCEVALQIKEEFIPCRASNIAAGGVLVQLSDDIPAILQLGDQGSCWMDFGDEHLEAAFRIARMAGRYLALRFIDLQQPQQEFLEQLVAAGEPS
ncbi:PilZ domain-containing protein [Pseudomaricurvus alkylphenolicus]|jgi:hypothetical protein|uniref:PilZ domain-containing protein n=1 Tax=Pseudomaricurvus alkylphenolicus TaxID=1306991 RepID=UPI0014223252|nr:PilZ domain-containing protein [Pseudomaricurvus alkylphenolicus]NIB42939.1 PilZ domain-containing protein [Pseudomaricurvus alkylphenolicus]